MNKIYRIIWSKVKHSWIVVSEIAKRCGKAGSQTVRAAVGSSKGATGNGGLLGTGNRLTGRVASSLLLAAVLAVSCGQQTAWAETKNEPIIYAEGVSVEGSNGTGSAFGWHTTASGGNSTAFGGGTIASEDWSTAFGNSTTASGLNSTAFGGDTTASGNYSTAFGEGTTASGGNSTAFGYETTASGPVSTAFGDATIASGDSSTAFGYGTTASGDWSTAFGYKSTASGVNATAWGGYIGVDAEDNLIEKAGGSAFGAGATAFGLGSQAGIWLYDNEEARIVSYENESGETRYKIVKASDGSDLDNNNDAGYDGEYEASQNLIVKGEASTAFGIESKAYADNSLAALGGYTEINATNSVAIGKGATASLADTVALGSGAVANRAAGAQGYSPDGKTYNGNAWVSTHNAIAVGASANDSDEATVTRQITGVAAGSKDTDAVNVAQLKKVTATPSISDTHNYYDGSTTAVKADEAVNAVDAALGKITDDNKGNYLSKYTAASKTETETVPATGTFADNLAALDTAMGKTEAGNYISATDGTKDNSLASQVQKLDTAIGAKISEDGNYIKKSETNAVNANIQALDTQAKVNADAIAENTSNITTLGDRVTTNETGIAKNAEGIAANKTAIETNAANITTLGDRVTTNEAGIAKNAEGIAANKTAIETNAAGITALDGRVTTAEGTITQHTTDIAKNAGDITALSGRVSTNENTIAQHTTDIAKNAEGIAANKTAIETNAANITTLGDRVTTNETGIAKNAEGIAALSGRVSTNESTIAQHTTDIAKNAEGIAANKTAIETNAAGITALGDRVTTNEAGIAKNADDITALSGRVSTNENNITDLGDRVTATEADIATNKTAITKNAEDITALDTRVTNSITALDAVKATADAAKAAVDVIGDTEQVKGLVADVSNLKSQDGQIVPEGEERADEFVKGNTVYEYLNKDNVSFGDNSTKIAIGKDSKIQSGTQSLAIGFGNTVDGDQNVAIGTGHTVKGSHNIAIGDPIELVGDNNGVIGNNVTINGSNTFVLGNNVTANVDNAVVLGNNSTAEANAVSVGSEGGERQIKHVAPGMDDTDAVNVAQLKAVDQNAVNNDIILNNRISNLDGKINKVGAGAAALAALHPIDTDDKFTMGLGYGNYRSSHAAAIGMFYRPTDKVMLSIGGSMGNGENLINVGVSFALDKGKGFGTSKAAMARKISLQEEKIAAQDEKIAAQEAENAEQRAEIQALKEALARLEAKVNK